MRQYAGPVWDQAFMVEMNINSVLKDLGVDGVSCSLRYGQCFTRFGRCILCWCGPFMDSATHLGEVVVLDSIIDMDELKEKVQAVCVEKGLL